MSQILQLIVSIILLSSIYTVVALGFQLSLDNLGMMNLAHGEIILIGSYTAWWFNSVFRIEPLLSLIFVMPLSFALGYFLQHSAAQRLPALLLMSFAASMILRYVFRLLFSSSPRTVESTLGAYWQLGTLYFPMMRSVMLFFAVLLLFSLWAFFKWTNLGKSIRCVAQNPEAAFMLGIEVETMRAFALALAFMLAALTGVLISPIYTITPALGQWLTLKSVAVVFLRWRRGLVALVFGALALASLETLLATYVPGIGAAVSELSAPLIIFLALLARWQRLLGG